MRLLDEVIRGVIGNEVFYLSSKFNIRVIWLTYVLRFFVVFFAQCNHRFVIFGSGYRHCIAPMGGSVRWLRCREVSFTNR